MQAIRTREWAMAVAEATGLPVRFRDERLTSERAERRVGTPARGRSGGPPTAAQRDAHGLESTGGGGADPPGRAGRPTTGDNRSRRADDGSRRRQPRSGGRPGPGGRTSAGGRSSTWVGTTSCRRRPRRSPKAGVRSHWHVRRDYRSAVGADPGTSYGFAVFALLLGGLVVGGLYFVARPIVVSRHRRLGRREPDGAPGAVRRRHRPRRARLEADRAGRRLEPE